MLAASEISWHHKRHSRKKNCECIRPRVKAWISASLSSHLHPEVEVAILFLE